MLAVPSNLQHNCCLVVHYNPDTRVSNGSGAVQICINLVQAMAPIWRQWFTGDSGLSLLTIPAVSALGGSTCGDPLLNLASSTLFPDTIKYILTASVIHMYVVYSRSVYILVICCVVHFDRWQEKSYNIWQVQVQSQKYKYQ